MNRAHAPTVEEAEAALAEALNDDSIDWADDAVSDADDDDAYDPAAMKDVLREEGLDALYDDDEPLSVSGGETDDEEFDADAVKDALREEGLDALMGSEDEAADAGRG